MAEKITHAHIALAIGLALLPAAATAHDHYQWIMDNTATSHCCGPRDCRQVDPRTVRYDGGWLVRERPVPKGHTYPSRDQDHHACYADPGRWLEIRCLFIPGVS